tara:strand:- start:39 stop:578 length:540 start_codon:yes stop_codon:yes gene_type:complete
MKWFDILKNAKLGSKSKGKTGTLDASKIKINIKDDCKEKLRKLIWFNTTEPAPDDIAQQVDTSKNGNTLIDTKEFNKLPEQIACRLLQELKSHDFDAAKNYKDLNEGWGDGYAKARIKHFGDSVVDYRLWLEIHFSKGKRLDSNLKDEDVIRYYILNGLEDVAWIMFPFSDIKKWKAAL